MRKISLSLSWERASSIIVSISEFNQYFYIETYERKGKMGKKSIKNDKFKERQFVLDKDQLFFYKYEK